MKICSSHRIMGLLASALLMGQPLPAEAQVAMAAATHSPASAHPSSPGLGGGGGMMGGGGMYGMTRYCQQSEAANSGDLARVAALLEAARTSRDTVKSRADIAKAQALLAGMRKRTSTCSAMMGQMRQMMRGGGSKMQTPATPGKEKP